MRPPTPIPRLATAALFGLAAAVAIPAAADPAPAVITAADARPAAGVFGRVVGEVEPLSAARVYAYQLADLTLHEVATSDDGQFRFPKLPAGLYKIIAHKTGFVPAVVMLTRGRQDARQFLELQLASQRGVEAESDDFWAVRERIPPDVLREMLTPADPAGALLADSPFDRSPRLDVPGFATEMEAMTGVEQGASFGEALLTGGQVGVEGHMGSVRVGLSGDYWRLGPAGSYADAETGGQMRQLALQLEGGPAEMALSTRSQRLVGTDDEPVDFEVHRLSWSQDLGTDSRAHVAAQYSSQTNYYGHNLLAPVEIPRQSSSWAVEGTYTRDASDHASFQGGFRYRDRTVGVATAQAFGGDGHLQEERLDLFGRSGVRVRPAVLLEYGLYTTLRDGSLALAPQGGLVLQLGDAWQASTLVSRKVTNDDEAGPRDFIPAFYHESSSCTQGEESCYKLLLTRQRPGDESSFSLGAVHREIGETLRLFFNDDFFNHLESLYLVRGDELPELELGATRRIAPKLVARLESNVGSGGGGIFYATDQSQYENSVRYLVTSLDTHYQGTATGLFISFHHLEQSLEPLGGSGVREAADPPLQLQLQRFQLMLTQDLNILMDVAADWAVKLNMEMSRGSVLFSPEDAGGGDDETRRRILGGFAVRF